VPFVEFVSLSSLHFIRLSGDALPFPTPPAGAARRRPCATCLTARDGRPASAGKRDRRHSARLASSLPGACVPTHRAVPLLRPCVRAFEEGGVNRPKAATFTRRARRSGGLSARYPADPDCRGRAVHLDPLETRSARRRNAARSIARAPAATLARFVNRAAVGQIVRATANAIRVPPPPR